MEKKITTVLGDIAPSDLGFTSMHDHTFLDMSVSAEFMESIFFDVDKTRLDFIPENYDYLKTGIFLLSKDLKIIDDMEGLKTEYGYFKERGGQSVLDPTPTLMRVPGYSGKIMQLSRETGLNFITATGFYHDAAMPMELRGACMETFYEAMRSEVISGIGDSGVRPGCLKGALNTCSQTEQNNVEACIRLCAETGLSVHVHTEPTVEGDDILSILDDLCSKYSVDHDRVHICHMDNRLLAHTMVMDFLEDPKTQRTLNLDTQIALLDRGYTIGLDTWGIRNDLIPTDVKVYDCFFHREHVLIIKGKRCSPVRFCISSCSGLFFLGLFRCLSWHIDRPFCSLTRISSLYVPDSLYV